MLSLNNSWVWTVIQVGVSPTVVLQFKLLLSAAGVSLDIFKLGAFLESCQGRSDTFFSFVTKSSTAAWFQKTTRTNFLVPTNSFWGKVCSMAQLAVFKFQTFSVLLISSIEVSFGMLRRNLICGRSSLFPSLVGLFFCCWGCLLDLFACTYGEGVDPDSLIWTRGATEDSPGGKALSRTVGQDEILSVLVSLPHPLNEDGSLEAMTSRRCSNSEEFCLISKTSLLRDLFSAVSFQVETTASLIFTLQLGQTQMRPLLSMMRVWHSSLTLAHEMWYHSEQTSHSSAWSSEWTRTWQWPQGASESDLTDMFAQSRCEATKQERGDVIYNTAGNKQMGMIQSKLYKLYPTKKWCEWYNPNYIYKLYTTK